MPLLLVNSAWIAVASAAGAAAAALAAFALLTRGRRRRSNERARRLESSNERIEAKLAALARDLARARGEVSRTRELAAIGSTIDLDVVLARALEYAAALPLIDAAMIVVHQEKEAPLVATYGMSAEEAARHPIAAAPAAGETRAVEVAFRHTGDSGADIMNGGLVLPLRDGGEESIGTLATFWRSGDREPSDDEVAALEDLVRNAGPAIENARRFREARKLADLDGLTNLHNRRYFHDTLAREVARAQRYGRRLGLVIFDVDDFKAINERVGHLSGDSVLAQLAERIRSVARSADIACRVGGDEFAVILPESGLADAEQLYLRVQAAVSTSRTGASDRIHLSAGIAEFRPDDDAVTFFERADEALFRAKQTGKAQAVAADHSE